MYKAGLYHDAMPGYAWMLYRNHELETLMGGSREYWTGDLLYTGEPVSKMGISGEFRTIVEHLLAHGWVLERVIE